MNYSVKQEEKKRKEKSPNAALPVTAVVLDDSQRA